MKTFTRNAKTQTNPFCIGAVLTFIACFAGLALCCIPDARADVALFKSFLETPPANITNLVFKTKRAGDTFPPLALVWDEKLKAFVHSEKLAHTRGDLETGRDVEGFRWFRAEWQDNAFLVQGIDLSYNGSALANNPTVFRSGGRYASNYWSLVGGTLQTWTAPGPISPEADGAYKRGKTSSAHKGALLSSEPLRQLLSLGIMSVDPGTIRWQGDQFSIPSRDIEGVVIRGTAVVEKDRVSRLEVSYNEFPYVIEYDYSGDLPLSYLPKRFLVSYVGNGKKEFRHEFEIILMQPAPNPLSGEEFQLLLQQPRIRLGSEDYFVHSTVERHWVYTNGTGPFRLETNGVLTPL